MARDQTAFLGREDTHCLRAAAAILVFANNCLFNMYYAAVVKKLRLFCEKHDLELSLKQVRTQYAGC